jgi:Fe-S oxidoreductase
MIGGLLYKYNHCGKCEKAPCDIWRSTRDPKFTDEEFEENIRERITNLKLMI